MIDLNEILERFLDNLGKDHEEIEEGAESSWVIQSDSYFKGLMEKAMRNAYYYSSMKDLHENSFRIRLNEIVQDNCAKVDILVSRNITLRETKIECKFVGFEAVLPSGVVILVDSLQSKAVLGV